MDGDRWLVGEVTRLGSRPNPTKPTNAITSQIRPYEGLATSTWAANHQLPRVNDTKLSSLTRAVQSLIAHGKG